MIGPWTNAPKQKEPSQPKKPMCAGIVRWIPRKKMDEKNHRWEEVRRRKSRNCTRAGLGGKLINSPDYEERRSAHYKIRTRVIECQNEGQWALAETHLAIEPQHLHLRGEADLPTQKGKQEVVER